MVNTYSQISIHLVFAVKRREHLISQETKEELHKYITGIVDHNECKVIAINAMPDHLHLLIGLNPKIALSDLVRDIKANSSSFIKQKEWSPTFAWQEGYGSFSHSRSQRSEVIRYIQNQEEHHRKKTFREEYIDFLKANDIDYDERYIFSEPG